MMGISTSARMASRSSMPCARIAAAPPSATARATAVMMRGERGGGRQAVFGDGALLGIGLLRDGLLEPRTVIAGAT